MAKPVRQQFGGKLWRGALARGDERPEPVGQVGGLLKRPVSNRPVQDRRAAGVARADGIGVRVRVEPPRLANHDRVRRVQRRSEFAACQHEQIEVEMLNQLLDFLRLAKAEQRGDGGQFGLVHLDDRGGAAAGLEQLSREIVLPQIKVEQPYGLAGGGSEFLDRGSRRFEPLAKRAKTNGVATLGQSGERLVPSEPVPCRVADDFVLRLAVAEGDLDRAGRGITIGLNEGRAHAAPGQVVEQRPAKRVAADTAGHHGVVTELVRLDGGVERRPSKRGAGGEQVVKRLAQADDDWR